MRTLLSIILVIAASAPFARATSMTSDQGAEWVKDRVELYLGPHNAFRVTIESGNGVVSIIEVPKGVILSIVASEYETHESREASDYPRLFRGDMTIRTRRNDEVKEGESTRGSDLMATAPLEVTLHGVVVSIELED